MPAILDSTSKSLEVVLAGSVTTNELSVVVSYADLDAAGGSLTPTGYDVATTGATAATVAAAPASGVQRVIKALSVYNADTAPATVTVRLNNGGTIRPLKTLALAAGESRGWTEGSGWG